MNNVDYKRFVRYFYDPPPRNEDVSGSPIWCLGKQYHTTPLARPEDVSEVESTDSQPPSELSIPKSTPSSESSIPKVPSETDVSVIEGNGPSDTVSEGGWPSAFLDDFESRLWMTYRSNFAPIPRSHDPEAASSMTFSVRLRNIGESQGFTSDTGWGCMIRSGQSLLANALLVLRQGRDWRKREEPGSERQVVSLFADDPKAPLSIHRFVEHGAATCGKHPGQWFGPSATASCIRHLAHQHPEVGLRVYVTNDSSDVYEDKFREIAFSEENKFIPTLVLLGIRLGIDRVTPVYWEALKATLQYPQSIGIAGGRPSASHYFVGHQTSKFFYLDPHETRPALPYHDAVEDYTPEELESCHTRRLRCLDVKDMDPSMLMGFLIRDEDDWRSWKELVSQAHGKPIIHIFDKEPTSAGSPVERQSAVDEVETFDDEDTTGAEEVL